MSEQEKQTEKQGAMGTAGMHRGMVPPEPIDFVEVAYILFRHSLAIMICAMLGFVGMLGYTYRFVPATYKATAKLYLVSASNNSIVNLSDLQMGSQLLEDYKELIRGRTMMKEVLRNLGLNWSPGALSSALSISNPSSSRILSITATTTDPKLSTDIANEVARQAMEFLPRIMACEAPNIAEVAEMPTGKSGPDYTGNAMKGAMGGAALAIGFFFLRFLLNDSLASPEEVTRYLQLETLAVVPENKEDKNRKRSVKGKRSERRPPMSKA